MPTARNGDAASHASIFHCSGAWHWSKPRPVKVPGVTGLAARAETAEAEEVGPSAPAGAVVSPTAVNATVVAVSARPVRMVRTDASVLVGRGIWWLQGEVGGRVAPAP